MTNNIAGQELLSFIERTERLDAEIKDLQDDKKEVYAEAKGRGYDVPTIKKIVQRRRQDPDARSEQEALLELYEDAIQRGKDPLDD